MYLNCLEKANIINAGEIFWLAILALIDLFINHILYQVAR